MDLLCGLNQKQGQTVVMVTHAPEIGARANRIVRMRDGSIEDDGLTSSQLSVVNSQAPVAREIPDRLSLAMAD